jgi:hypothetical protein
VALWKSAGASVRARPAWYLGAVGIVAVAAIATFVEIGRDREGDPSACTSLLARSLERPATPGTASGPNGLIPVDANAQRDPDARLSFAFGSSRTPIVRRQTFRVPVGVDRAAVRSGLTSDIVDPARDDIIDRTNVVARVSLVKVEPRLVNVSVCIDPARPVAAAPGTYSGAVLVNVPGAGVAPAPLPLHVTIRDEGKLVAMIAIFVGIVVAAALRTRADVHQRDTTYAEYIYSMSFLAMVFIGLLGGIAAYTKLYATVPDAELVPQSLVALGGASFTATLAGKSLTELEGAFAKRGGGSAGRARDTGQPGG